MRGRNRPIADIDSQRNIVTGAHFSVGEPTRSVQHQRRTNQKAGAAAHRSEPLDFGLDGLTEDAADALANGNCERIAETVAVFFCRALEIGLDAEDPPIIKLPIAADLPAANHAI